MHLIYSKLPEGKMSPLNVGGCVGVACSREISGDGKVFICFHHSVLHVFCVHAQNRL